MQTWSSRGGRVKGDCPLIEEVYKEMVYIGFKYSTGVSGVSRSWIAKSVSNEGEWKG